MKLVRRRSGSHESKSSEGGVETTTKDSYVDSDTFSQVTRRFSNATRWMTVTLAIFGVGLTAAFYLRERDVDELKRNICEADVADDLGDRALWFALSAEFQFDQEIIDTITAVLDREKPEVDVDEVCG